MHRRQRGNPRDRAVAHVSVPKQVLHLQRWQPDLRRHLLQGRGERDEDRADVQTVQIDRSGRRQGQRHQVAANAPCQHMGDQEGHARLWVRSVETGQERRDQHDQEPEMVGKVQKADGQRGGDQRHQEQIGVGPEMQRPVPGQKDHVPGERKDQGDHFLHVSEGLLEQDDRREGKKAADHAVRIGQDPAQVLDQPGDRLRRADHRQHVDEAQDQPGRNRRAEQHPQRRRHADIEGYPGDLRQRQACRAMQHHQPQKQCVFGQNPWQDTGPLGKACKHGQASRAGITAPASGRNMA